MSPADTGEPAGDKPPPYRSQVHRVHEFSGLANSIHLSFLGISVGSLVSFIITLATVPWGGMEGLQGLFKMLTWSSALVSA